MSVNFLEIIEWIFSHGDRGLMMAAICVMGYVVYRMAMDRLRLELANKEALSKQETGHQEALRKQAEVHLEEKSKVMQSRSDLEVAYRTKIEDLKDKFAVKVEELMNRNLDTHGKVQVLLAECRDALRRIDVTAEE